MRITISKMIVTPRNSGLEFFLVKVICQRVDFPCGGIAQLVERLVRNEKVRGSNPLTSTTSADGKNGPRKLRGGMMGDKKMVEPRGIEPRS